MIDAQGMIFLTAGFETTANTMGSLLYHVSCNPEIQDKIFDEILDTIGSDEITHDNISKLDYLEACIMETLRLCPPVIEHDRVCTNDCVVQGITVKKALRFACQIIQPITMPSFSRNRKCSNRNDF